MTEVLNEDTVEKKEEQEPEIHYPYTVCVKFHNSNRAYSFGTFMPDIKQGESVVVETSQGVELGICQVGSTDSSLHPLHLPLKPVLRIADENDRRNYQENFEYSKQAFAVCQEEIAALQLEMHLLTAEYMLDRSKVLFVYQAEQRVDFRELLKRLGSRLHCRIELRQIGERDKAKMVGGIGMCGMECCCSRFKTHMDVISINMAKNQLLALNTEKLSGMCGKLMCCLKYENDNYKILTEGLPKMGAHVEYDGAFYRVTSMNVMTNEARLENSETFQVITIDELKNNAVVRKGVTIAKKQPRTAQKNTAPGIHKTDSAPADFRATDSEKTRGISAESKDTTQRTERPVQKPKTETRHFTKKPAEAPAPKPKEAAASRPQNKDAGRKNVKNDDRRRQNVRRPNKIDTKNPNVTVRSFKSSKTREMEAKEEKK
ncbi:MAG: hypothetical protein K6D03_05340 [Solobacterium sp.]|nr:hypothetical protein [Solobacterium sp.]